MLLGIGLSQGTTLGRLISMALDISGSGIILTAFAGDHAKAFAQWVILLTLIRRKLARA